MVQCEYTAHDADAVLRCVLFQDCDSAAVEKYLHTVGVTVRQFAAGEVIPTELRQGCCGVVLEGSVRIYADEGGNAVLLNVPGSGEAFDIAAITGQGSGAPASTAKAAGKSRVAFLGVCDLRTLMRDYPDIAVNCMQFFCDRIQFLNRRIRTISRSTAEQKLADFLLSEFQQENGAYFVRLKSCVELSKRLNLSRASLYRALGHFEQSGAISRSGKLIRLLNLDALQSV